MAATLSPGFKALALKLQEASMMQSDVRSRLSDALRDATRGSGSWCYYLDHDGDGETGNCVYCCDGDTLSAPYTISDVNGKAACSVDMENAVDVVPVMTYQPEAEDADHYVAMESEKLYAVAPVYERFISKSTRKAASGDSFAGKGRSFPILKAEDVSAALHSIGRAGPGNYSSDTIRSNIKRIAKAKGFALPDSLKDTASESDRNTGDENCIRLVESAGIEPLKLKESGAINPLVKIISPGRGSSGYYTKELLERDGPQIFKRGTLMYINHATAAEEAARPEGDYSKLAAVTTADAYWDGQGPDGPALYAPAKVFSGVAAEVAEKAPFTGVSIRASGQYAEAKGSGLTKKIAESKIAPDGKPGLIGKLTNADSIDLVTKAGRDGKLLLESATEGENDMDKNEVQALIESSLAPLKAENKSLREMLHATKAPAIIGKHLVNVRLPEAAKQKIIEGLMFSVPMTEAGAVDDVKLAAMVEAQAKDWAALLPALGVNANPAAFGTPMSEADVTADIKEFGTEQSRVAESLADLFVGEKDPNNKQREAARLAIVKGRAA